MARKIEKIYILTQSQKALKTKKFKKIIEKNDDVKMRHYVKIILVSLNFLQPKLEGVASRDPKFGPTISGPLIYLNNKNKK